MRRKAFSTTADASTLKALKLLAVKQDRPLNEVLEEAAEDADTLLFFKRAKEPLKDCLAAIERRIAHIKKQRG